MNDDESEPPRNAPKPDRFHSAGPLQLRWQLHRADRDHAVLRDIMDCSELAAAAGLLRERRMLDQLVTLRSGFAHATERRPQVASDTRFSIVVAVRELRALLPIPIPARPRAARTLSMIQARFGREPREPAKRPASDFRVAEELVGRLCKILREPPSGPLAEDLEHLLGRIERDILPHPPFVLRDHLGEPLIDLVARFAWNVLGRFFRENHGLCYAPLGSAALFHASARLSASGLGPYLRNVQQLVRGGRDIFGLIQVATQRDDHDGVRRDVLEHWSALLGIHLDRPTRIDLVNELSDLDLSQAIADILEIASPQAETHQRRDLLWNVRDAALDNGDLALAGRAQGVITERWRHERIEWRILGDIAATAGDRRAAVRAFVNMLRIERNDGSARDRLNALRADRFSRLAVTAGYGTPHHRQAKRLHRRSGSKELSVIT